MNESKSPDICPNCNLPLRGLADVNGKTCCTRCLNKVEPLETIRVEFPFVSVSSYPLENQSLTHSGSKYLRELKGLIDGRADVYAILETFNVSCPARQHAIKKLLCSGLRGKGDSLQDLRECRDAIDRAIQLEESRQAKTV